MKSQQNTSLATLCLVVVVVVVVVVVLGTKSSRGVGFNVKSTTKNR